MEVIIQACVNLYIRIKTNMETTSIYILRDPRNNEVRYVGKANNPFERYRNHNNQGRDKNTHKRNWINELRKDKLKPILEIIDTVPVDKWKEYEKFYIKKYIEEGCNLVNYTNGGDGCTFGNQTSFKPGNGAKKVVMLEKDGTYIRTFDMIIEAEKFINIKTNGVAQVLVKRNKTCKGFLFIYEEEYKNMTKEDIEDFVERSKHKESKPNKGSWTERIICQYDINGNLIKEWKSLADASKNLKVNRAAICNCARGKSNTSSGYLWAYKK